MRVLDCHSDLVARARRHRLSAADQARLEEHLSACPSCRFDRQIGARFDEVAVLHPGYEVLDAQLAEAVLQRLQPTAARGPWRVRPWLRAAVATWLVAAAASAAIVAWRYLAPPKHPSGERHDPLVASVAATPMSIPGPVAEVALQENDQELAVAASPPDAPAPSRATVVRSTTRAPATDLAPPGRRQVVSADDETAAALFERATLERQHKHAAAAIELYRELQRRYPATNEARVSHVSLGRLLLENGTPSEAIAQFDDYLSAPGDGLLAPETLFGKARALEALGRREEARATWRRLLASFPDSVYTAQARQRLEASP